MSHWEPTESEQLASKVSEVLEKNVKMVVSERLVNFSMKATLCNFEKGICNSVSLASLAAKSLTYSPFTAHVLDFCPEKYRESVTVRR